jgi:hypothetical protein
MAAHVVLLVEGRALEAPPEALRHHADPRVGHFFAGELA